MKVSILISVYNEAATVATLLERVWTQPLPGITKEIIIVESNSNDGSREIVADFVRRYAASSSIRINVIFQDRARGKGHAIREAFAAATGNIYLIQDADLEYDVSDYPDLLKPITEGRSAFVLGSRYLGPRGWKIRTFERNSFLSGVANVAGILLHSFFNIVYGTRLTDPTTMYKVFRADCLNGLTFTCERFDFDWELVGKLIRAGFEPLEVSVNYRSRAFHQGKKIRMFKDPPTWIIAILKTRFATLYVPKGRAAQVSAPPSVKVRRRR
jgi:glycosyltransferase involved in cell wall biosynthesis